MLPFFFLIIINNHEALQLINNIDIPRSRNLTMVFIEKLLNQFFDYNK